MHDSFEKINDIMAKTNITEDDILQCKNTKVFKQKLKEHQEKFEVYDKLQKELAKMKQKLGSTTFTKS